MMKKLMIAAICGTALVGCGGKSKPSKAELAKACGQRAAANSFSPGFGGTNRPALQQAVAQAAADYYELTGICSADQ